MPASSSAHLTLRSRTSPCANGGTDLNALTLIILTFLVDAIIAFSPTSVTFARRGVAPLRRGWRTFRGTFGTFAGGSPKKRPLRPEERPGAAGVRRQDAGAADGGRKRSLGGAGEEGGRPL